MQYVADFCFTVESYITTPTLHFIQLILSRWQVRYSNISEPRLSLWLEEPLRNWSRAVLCLIFHSCLLKSITKKKMSLQMSRRAIFWGAASCKLWTLWLERSGSLYISNELHINSYELHSHIMSPLARLICHVTVAVGSFNVYITSLSRHGVRPMLLWRYDQVVLLRQ